jgi:hypothetical protein
MKLMITRKQIVRERNTFERSDPEYAKLNAECDRLEKEAQALGGLNSDEAQVLAYCH